MKTTWKAHPDWIAKAKEFNASMDAMVIRLASEVNSPTLKAVLEGVIENNITKVEAALESEEIVKGDRVIATDKAGNDVYGVCLDVIEKDGKLVYVVSDECLAAVWRVGSDSIIKNI